MQARGRARFTAVRGAAGAERMAAGRARCVCFAAPRLQMTSMLLRFMALVVGVAFGQQADPVTLRDHAIASSSAPVYLDGAWTAVNVVGASISSTASGSSLAATVPGDILSDLQRAKRAPDPYWNTTWREPTYVAMW